MVQKEMRTKPALRQCQKQMQNLSDPPFAHLPAISAAHNSQADSRSAGCHGVNGLCGQDSAAKQRWVADPSI